MQLPLRPPSHIYDHRTNWLAFALPVIQTVSNSNNELSKPHPLREHQHTVNPRTGRLEVVFVDLMQVYPNADDPMSSEFSFEELRARHRGWLDRDWAAHRRQEQEKMNKPAAQSPVINQPQTNTTPLVTKKPAEQARKAQTVPLKGIEEDLILNDENTPPSQAEVEKAKIAKKARREERANRTRKIKVMETREIRAETQTSILPHHQGNAYRLANIPQFKQILTLQLDLR